MSKSLGTGIDPLETVNEHGADATRYGLLKMSSTQDVRFSTVYDREGSPKKAGLELWMPGDEMPRRLGGAAICGTRIRRGEHMISLSFFRWSMEGVPAYGSYEVVERQ